MRVILWFLRGKRREALLLRCMSPAGWQLYLTMQDTDAWELDYRVSGQNWLHKKSMVYVSYTTDGALRCGSPAVLSGFDKYVLKRELRSMENRKVAAQLVRAMAGEGT